MSPVASIRRHISLEASWWSASVVRMNRSKEMFSFSCRRWNTSELRRASSAVGMPFRLRGLDHLEAVLVGPGQETHVEAVEPIEPRDGVSGDVLVRVPDVRVAVGVGDRGGDVVGLHGFIESPPYCVRVGSQRSGKREAPPAPEPLAPLIDAHTHLDACGARGRRRRAGHRRACRCGRRGRRWSPSPTTWTSARWVTRAAEWDPRVYAAVALHPTRAAALNDAARAEIEQLAAHPRVVAVGETGMDLYWPGPPGRLRAARRAAGSLRLAYRPGQAVRETADDPQPGRRRRGARRVAGRRRARRR